MEAGKRYVDGAYLDANPDWDRKDAQWKVERVASILIDNNLSPRSICDVGCGAGDVLAGLKEKFPHAILTGFDVSPQLARFWNEHSGITFRREDFHRASTESFDVLTMLDVFEHVRDPFTFLEQTRGHAEHFVFHIPLDLSAISVARPGRLMQVRRQVGHLHFYTRAIALETLRECGYEILDWRYTHLATTLRTHWTAFSYVADIPRRLLRVVSNDLSAHVLGGESLVVLAR